MRESTPRVKRNTTKRPIQMTYHLGSVRVTLSRTLYCSHFGGWGDASDRDVDKEVIGRFSSSAGGSHADGNACLETALIGIYAILNVDGLPIEQVIKIGKLVDVVTLYKK